MRVLDVGTTSSDVGASNYFLANYPHPASLTACGLENPPSLCRECGIDFVQADGCSLPFADGAFDLVHSNAVLEHVGSRERQEQFVAEMCRVAARGVWLNTPDAQSPLESHTLIPLAHWLPWPMRRRVYKTLNRGYFSDEENLHLLSAGALRRRFPAALRAKVEIRKQYLLGLPAILIATLEL